MQTFTEKTAMLFDYLPMDAYLAVLALAAIAATAALAWSEKMRFRAARARLEAKREESRAALAASDRYDVVSTRDSPGRKTGTPGASPSTAPFAVSSTIAMAMILMSMLGAYALLDTYSTAVRHGYVDGMSVNAASLWPIIKSTPVESELPEDLSDCVVVCYRFGCEDCTALLPGIMDELSSIERVYYTSTRTPQGQEFIKKYPVDEVPSAVYVRADGTRLSYTLYTNDGTPSLDRQAMDDLMGAIAYGRSR